MKISTIADRASPKIQSMRHFQSSSDVLNGQNMYKGSFIVIVIVAATFLRMQAAAACTGSNIFLQDDFATFSPNWTHSNADWAGNGTFLITPALGTEQGALNSTSLPDDIDACVDVLLAAGDLTPGTPQLGHSAYAGLVFWATDFLNNYKFLVSPQGTFAVSRVFTRRPNTPFNMATIVNWTKSAAIKTGLRQVNTLRLVTNNTQATLYVNGTQLTTITGEPPQQGAKIGLIGASGAATKSFWHFTKLRVTN
jgi:hypothetical protein